MLQSALSALHNKSPKNLLDVLQSLNDPDVVQVNPPRSVPVLDAGAVFRDRQPLQELQQVVVVVVDDAIYRKNHEHVYKDNSIAWKLIRVFI